MVSNQNNVVPPITLKHDHRGKGYEEAHYHQSAPIHPLKLYLHEQPDHPLWVIALPAKIKESAYLRWCNTLKNQNSDNTPQKNLDKKLHLFSDQDQRNSLEIWTSLINDIHFKCKSSVAGVPDGLNHGLMQ
jgi:hypothetical protein